MIALALATLGVALISDWRATAQAQSGAPHYEADLSWPKPLPNAGFWADWAASASTRRIMS